MSNNNNLAPTALSRFPILERVDRFTSTTTLVRLGSMCRNLRDEIFDAEMNLKNDLRRRTRCDGVGMRIRNIFHKRPPADHPQGPFTNIARCGGGNDDVHEQECDTCGAVTCDECRVNLVYQDTQGLNHWAGSLWGYVLLDTELRYCWTAVDDEGEVTWDNSEVTHNDGLQNTYCKRGRHGTGPFRPFGRGFWRS
jgi:hypothetical protein